MASEITIETRDAVSLVSLRGSLDGSTAPVVQDRVASLIVPDCRLVLDMTEVEFMSSAGLRMMLLFFRQVSAQKGKIVLLGVCDDIRDTMSLTGFLDFFTTTDTVAVAVPPLPSLIV